MITLGRFLLVLGGIIGLYVAFIGFSTSSSIMARPEQWMGTGDSTIIILWLYLSVVAAGFIGLVGLLSFLGAIFGPKRRKGAFWLLVLPGILGLLTAVTACVLVILNQPDWESYLPWIALGLGLPPLFSLVFGIAFRRVKDKPDITATDRASEITSEKVRSSNVESKRYLTWKYGIFGVLVVIGIVLVAFSTFQGFFERNNSSPPPRSLQNQQPVIYGGQPDIQWGAIAYAPDGAWGTTWSAVSKLEAERYALERCRKHNPRGCEVKTSFTNCASFARSREGYWGWATRDSLSDAINGAIQNCQSRTTEVCNTLTSLCADGRGTE